MNPAAIIKTLSRLTLAARYTYLFRAFFSGLLIPLGFAPFHMPGLCILGLALLVLQLPQQTVKQSFFTGFIFGVGFLGFGVSWIYVSIHQYGHLNTTLAGLITLLFVLYLSIYPALVAVLYNKLIATQPLLFSCFLFSALWCLSEFLRSTIMGGFPWLLLGYSQMDTPLKYLLPIGGVFGVSFIVCLAATLLAAYTQVNGWIKQTFWLIAFIALVLTPSLLKNKDWTTISNDPISVGIIQANLSMRDKWDETLFWTLLDRYKEGVDQLIEKNNLIVMPESAIPLPAHYIIDYLDTMNHRAKRAGSAILLGIPKPTTLDETYYYNTILSLGAAKGSYLKQHLVPFGEFIPTTFQRLVNWLNIPIDNLKPGRQNQPLIQVQNHPIATLICYELAFPQLLRKQLPSAQWIVSISDDGWFGHSLAMYQHLQMAQVLSIQTGRFHVVANNDGLSSTIDAKGNITASLREFSEGTLETTIYPATGYSPWTSLGDTPIALISLFIVLFAFFARRLRLGTTNAVGWATRPNAP